MSSKAWQSYEEVARYLLDRFADHFQLGRVEGKQLVPGKSGAKWEIDAKAVCADGETFLVVECKRYPESRINQESIAGLAFRIQDTGAQGGIVVSPIGLQSGAKKVAASSNIGSVTLSPQSTTSNFIMKFLDQVFRGIGVSETMRLTDSARSKVIRDGRHQ